MRKIICQNDEHKRVFAHQLDDGTIDIVRQDQRFTVVGNDFIIYGTNPQGGSKTVLMVKDGKLQDDDLEFKDEEVKVDKKTDGDESQNPAEKTEKPDSKEVPKAD